MKTMMQLLQELTPLNRAVCSAGYDRGGQQLVQGASVSCNFGAKLETA